MFSTGTFTECISQFMYLIFLHQTNYLYCVLEILMIKMNQYICCKLSLKCKMRSVMKVESSQACKVQIRTNLSQNASCNINHIPYKLMWCIINVRILMHVHLKMSQHVICFLLKHWRVFNKIQFNYSARRVVGK